MLSCFSQNTYPSKLVIENDTIVAITPLQLNYINKLIAEKNFLYRQNQILQDINLLKDSTIYNLNLNLSYYQDIYNITEVQLSNLNLQLKAQKSLAALDRKKYKKTKWVIGGVSIGVGVLIGFLICK